MNFFTKTCTLITAILVCISVDMVAQSRDRQTVTLSGRVVVIERGTEVPVPYAMVSLPKFLMTAITDVHGEFTLSAVPAGTQEVQVTSLGYETLDISEMLSADKIGVKYVMTTADFYVEDVVVTAEASKSGASTASKISRMALDHMQASSLADVSRLLPGAGLADSREMGLQGMNNLSIRGGSSLGAGVIVDGAPLSNNANLQVLSTARGTESATGRTINSRSINATPISGVDLRSTSVTNIESIEVIRGIPSVQYGDIGSGVMIVNSKAGLEPLNIEGSVNPNIMMFKANQGFNLGRNANSGAINYGADYTFGHVDPSEPYEYYNRATGRVGYTNTFGRFYTNSSVSLSYQRDRDDPHPLDEHDLIKSLHREFIARFNTNGTLNVSKGWFKSVRYALSYSYGDKKSWRQERVDNSDWPYTFSMTDGTVLPSNKLDANGNPTDARWTVYDEEGDPIAKIPSGEQNTLAWMLPYSYESEYNILSKEHNTFAQVMANFAGQLGATSHRIVIGADWRNSGNTGDGKVFSPANPPRRSPGVEFHTHRERAFRDIPFMNHLGVFAEESFNVKFWNRNLDITAGMRYDKVWGIDKGGLAPRVNASLEIIPGTLSIRGGYGVQYKSPTLGLLYPDNAYFDILNFNNANTAPSDAQKFQIMTTRIFDTKNPNLELAREDKAEVGLDLSIGKARLSLTGYYDKSYNGYALGYTRDSYRVIDYVRYTDTDVEYPENTSEIPAIKFLDSNKYLASWTTPTNSAAYERTGIEMELDLGRFDAIRTHFLLTGTWSRQEQWTNSETFFNRRLETDPAKYPHTGLFPAKTYSQIYEEMSTGLTVTHNIPKIGFVITVSARVQWIDHPDYFKKYFDDAIPANYISRIDGQIRPVDPSLIETDEFYQIHRNEVSTSTTTGRLDPRYFEKPANYKPWVTFNINVTKEIGDYLRVSFFANNMFRHYPVRVDKRFHEYYVMNRAKTSNSWDSYYFGLTLSAKINFKKR